MCVRIGNGIMRLIGTLLFFFTASGFAGEYAILAGGGRLKADRHETDGAKVRLYSGAGYVELDAAKVAGFETVEEPAAVKTAAAPPVAAVPAPAAPAPTPRELADRAADKYGLPRALVRGVMAAESGGRADAVSPKGAIGLMQLMPSTAKDLGADPFDPEQNVDAGTRYLRDLLVKYDYRLWHALAAYNAGSGAVDRYNGVPPYRETLRYVDRIDRAYQKPVE